ncbi:MAG: phosphatase PAP2 family protein [Rhodobacteraceae bacterium]|nr:phosphatase PAP2 family protein [Paracoccaceae bacterium]
MEQVEAIGGGASRWTPIVEAFSDVRVLAFGTGLYLIAGNIFLAYVGANPIDLVEGIGVAFATFFQLVKVFMPWWALLIVVAPIVLIAPIRRRLWQQRTSVLLTIMMCSLFTFMFALVKNRMSLVEPFWADNALTKIDLMLHFGHTPRDLLLWLSPEHTSRLLGLYFNTWVFLASFLPVLLVAFDNDKARRRTFTILWMLCWVGLGNVLALMVMSYGPIFTDLFPGGPADAHRGALALVQREDARSLLATKMSLWRAYTGESEMLGSGISAFPSVHVGMAMVIGLYIARLGRDLSQRLTLKPIFATVLLWGARAFSVLYVTFYAVLSVYLGWHYAVDGYVSIVVILGLYMYLMARSKVPARKMWFALPFNPL